ncbi:hypothetical protein D3C79_547190 [compost metagenome]
MGKHHLRPGEHLEQQLQGMQVLRALEQPAPARGNATACLLPLQELQGALEVTVDLGLVLAIEPGGIAGDVDVGVHGAEERVLHQHELLVGLLGVQWVNGQQLREELDHRRYFGTRQADALQRLFQGFPAQGRRVAGFPPLRLAELRVHRQGALQQRGTSTRQADDHQRVVDLNLENLREAPTVVFDHQAIDQLRQ